MSAPVQCRDGALTLAALCFSVHAEAQVPIFSSAPPEPSPSELPAPANPSTVDSPDTGETPADAPDGAVPERRATPADGPAEPHASPPSTPPPSVVDVSVQGRGTETQRLQRSAEAVTVVDMRRAREQSADLGEVLARSQGVLVRRGGGLGSSERFSLNGLYDQQIGQFVDGIPLAIMNVTYGISTIPVNFVSRVELYRGVVPIRFGADALGGAVNIVTDQEYKSHASASYQLGSFGTQRATLAGRHHDATTGLVVGADAFVDAAKNDYEVDVQVPDERGQLSQARVPRFHDAYRAGGGSLEAGVLDKPWAKRLLLRGFIGGTAKELQHNVVMKVPYGEARYTTRNYGAVGRYELDAAPGLGFELMGAYNKRTVHFIDDSRWVYNWRGERVRERRVPGEIETPATNQLQWEHNAFARAGARWQLSSQQRLSFSSSAWYSTRTGDERLDADPNVRDPLNAERSRLSVVSGAEHQLTLGDNRVENVLFVKDYAYVAKSEEWLAAGGTKRRNVGRHRQGLGDAVRVRFLPWLYAKASYELATRLPTTDELFGDGVLVQPSLDLEPELSHNANLGPRVELTRTGAGDFVAEVNAFWRDSDRLIVLLGNDRYYAYQNVFRALSRGIETQLDWAAPKRRVNLYGGFTYIDQRNASSQGTFGSFEGDRVPNRPYLTASWGARLRFTGFPDADDALEPYYNGRYIHAFYRGWESQGLKEYKQLVEAQLLHSAGITWSLAEVAGRFTTTAEIDNLTNAEAFDNFGVQKPGRAYYLKLAAEL